MHDRTWAQSPEMSKIKTTKWTKQEANIELAISILIEKIKNTTKWQRNTEKKTCSTTVIIKSLIPEIGPHNCRPKNKLMENTYSRYISTEMKAFIKTKHTEQSEMQRDHSKKVHGRVYIRVSQRFCWSILFNINENFYIYTIT